MTTWIDSHANDASVWRVQLVQWTVSGSTYNWAVYDVPVVTDGGDGEPVATWSPCAIQVSGISSRQGESASKASLVFANADGSFTARAFASPGTSISVYEAWLDPTGRNVLPQQCVTLFDGIVDAWELSGDMLTLALTPAVPPGSVIVPRRTITTVGSALFKSAACGYTGATTSCNRTLAACQALSNDARFCGFPQLDPRS